MSSEQQAVTDGFDQWCVVELMGHLKLAGHVTEAQIGGASFLRIDVPNAEGETSYTRYFGAGSVYSITPVTKDVCLAVAQRSNQKPAFAWDLPRQLGGTVDAETVQHNHEREENDDDDNEDLSNW